MLRVITLAGALAFCPGVALGQQPCTTDARQVVNELYRTILQRSADRGSNTFVQRLRSGSATVRDIVGDLAKSPEYAQRFAATGNAEVNENAVASLYRGILGREADPEGLRAHAEGLRTSGLNAVVDDMINSDEYRQGFGDFGIPGTAGLRYCGPSERTSSRVPRGSPVLDMDVNRDGTITRAEWRGTAQAFNASDWNRDGVLSGDEVRPGATRPSGSDTARDSSDQIAWTSTGFADIDFNRDGRIARSEWLYEDDIFSQADRNRDGVLTRPEFLAGRDRAVGTSGSGFAGVDRFEALDRNQNGRVERNEWDGTRAAFDRLDTNGNNILSRAEVSNAAGGGTTEFTNLDTNRDGRLSIEEWNWNRRSFDRQDANRDGVITPREYTGVPGGANER
jgi:Ca2+-binding EF-hand superfamily protein